MSFAEFLPSGSPDSATANSEQSRDPGVGPAVHCGTAMELVTPALGPAAVAYTFAPDGGPVQLPPVWRCGCGFQLDAWIQSPYAHEARYGTADSGAQHNLALSA